eukprot:GGOE01053720.1.p2 GENE.GGOE01053720.1~~GGOE01053720.1.p2  ORF type:complete len:192 (+),score=46.16 GGOE01053720.1:42-578(+)
MASAWLRALLGLPVPEQLPHDIPHPKVELGMHVLAKSMQLSMALGVLATGPLLALRKPTTRHWAAVKDSAGRCGVIGLVLGVPLGLFLLHGRTWDMPLPMIYDRVYRLRHNEGQRRVDRSMVGGAVVGAALGRLVSLTALQGFSFGAVGAVGAASLYNAMHREPGAGPLLAPTAGSEF